MAKFKSHFQIYWKISSLMNNRFSATLGLFSKIKKYFFLKIIFLPIKIYPKNWHFYQKKFKKNPPNYLLKIKIMPINRVFIF
jgi:hypothetical protein